MPNCSWSAPAAGPLGRAVLGSVSQRCAARAACPVVLIKLPGERGADEVGGQEAAGPG